MLANCNEDKQFENIIQRFCLKKKLLQDYLKILSLKKVPSKLFEDFVLKKVPSKLFEDFVSKKIPSKLFSHLETLLSITFQLLDKFLLPLQQLLNVDIDEGEPRYGEVPVCHDQCDPLGQHLRRAVHQQRVDICGFFMLSLQVGECIQLLIERPGRLWWSVMTSIRIGSPEEWRRRERMKSST